MCFKPRLVVGFVEFEEVVALKRAASDDIIAIRVDDAEILIPKLFFRENPLLLQIGRGNDAQQPGLLLPSVFLVPHGNVVAEGQGLLPVHGVRIGPGDVDRLADIRYPGSVPDQFHPLIGNIVILRVVQPRPRRIACQGFRIDQVSGRVNLHMGHSDICRRFCQRQIPAVNVLRPDIADPLFTLQIVPRHLFHGNGRVDEMVNLRAVVSPSLIAGIQRNENQYGAHQGYIRYDNPRCLQTAHFNSSSRIDRLQGLTSYGFLRCFWNRRSSCFVTAFKSDMEHGDVRVILSRQHPVCFLRPHSGQKPQQGAHDSQQNPNFSQTIIPLTIPSPSAVSGSI